MLARGGSPISREKNAVYTGLLLLDFGGVIVDSPIDSLRAFHKNDKKLVLQRMQECETEWAALERGEHSVEAFCDMWEKKYATPTNGATEMRQWFAQMLTLKPHPQMEWLLAWLKHKFRLEVGIVTNNFFYSSTINTNYDKNADGTEKKKTTSDENVNSTWNLEHLRDKLYPETLSFADFVVESSKEGCRKGASADTKIFDIALKRSRYWANHKNSKRPRVFFIDDLAHNLVAPKTLLKMQTYHCVGPLKVVETIKTILLPRLVAELAAEGVDILMRQPGVVGNQKLYVNPDTLLHIPDTVPCRQPLDSEKVRQYLIDLIVTEDGEATEPPSSRQLRTFRAEFLSLAEAHLAARDQLYDHDRGPPVELADVDQRRRLLEGNLRLEVTQFNFGQSNPTYLLYLSFRRSSGGSKKIVETGTSTILPSADSIPKHRNEQPIDYEYDSAMEGLFETQCLVLRKQPPGKLLPKAHDMKREYSIMHALGEHTDIPVPRMLDLVEVVSSTTDDTISTSRKTNKTSCVGTSFYLMRYVPGVVYKTVRLEPLSGEPWKQRKLYENGIDVMKRIHAVEYEKIPSLLQVFGKADNFVERQVKRWDTQYRKSNGKDDVMLSLPNKLLDAQHGTVAVERKSAHGIVHGDCRLDNMIVDPKTLRIKAVLDWELSTAGFCLVDIASLLGGFPVSSSIGGISTSVKHQAIRYEDTECKGIPRLEELLSRYNENINLSDFRKVVAFQFFRLAGILQGVVDRRRKGTASAGGKVEGLFSEAGVQMLGSAANELISASGATASSIPSSKM